MSPVHRWHSRGRESPAPDLDLIELFVPSSALSCQRASVEADLRVAAVVGHWQLLPRRGGAGVLGGIRLIVG